MLSTVLRTGTAAAFLMTLGSAAVAQTLPGLPATPEPPKSPAPPPTTQPPGTQPPATQPPATQPPGTQPPGTRPPAAQPGTGTQPAPGAQPAAAPGATYRAKQIMGSRIMIGGSTAVGTVDDLVFDNAGNLEYLVVANEGRMVTVPWDAATFDLKAQTGSLNMAPDVYRKLPTYTGTTYPDFYAPTYRTEVYRSYGLTPRDLRRIDRALDRPGERPVVPPPPARP